MLCNLNVVSEGGEKCKVAGTMVEYAKWSGGERNYRSLLVIWAPKYKCICIQIQHHRMGVPCC